MSRVSATGRSLVSPGRGRRPAGFPRVTRSSSDSRRRSCGADSEPSLLPTLAFIIHDTLSLTPGTRLGIYEVTRPSVKAGWGRCTERRIRLLGRQVAIKILPDAFASDPERLARFEREAKTLASLNHPHIAAIYALEKSAGVHALVMELVEGEDLSQRIARGRNPDRRSVDDREADCGGARSGARAGDHPSRSQTGQHQSAAGRHREGARLRARQSDASSVGSAPDMSRSHQPSRRRP